MLTYSLVVCDSTCAAALEGGGYSSPPASLPDGHHPRPLYGSLERYLSSMALKPIPMTSDDQGEGPPPPEAVPQQPPNWGYNPIKERILYGGEGPGTPPASMGDQFLAADKALAQAGLPRELLGLPSSYSTQQENLDGPNNGSSYYQGDDNSVHIGPQYRDSMKGGADPWVAIHESLHSFESFLTPEERAQLDEIIARNPIPTGIPSRHHPGGITDYFDYQYGGYRQEENLRPPDPKDESVPQGPPILGQRRPGVPLEIQGFLRDKMPQVSERAKHFIPTPQTPAIRPPGVGDAGLQDMTGSIGDAFRR